VSGYTSLRIFPLYNELTSRDLLQRRITDENGNTHWADSPLIRAAREGSMCVLDGLHALDVHALTSLRRLLQDGVVDLPNGERLKMEDGRGSFKCDRFKSYRVDSLLF
jgi:von Willebrand factor A domain-containing protein 8